MRGYLLSWAVMTKEGLVIDEEHAMDCSGAVGLVVPMGDGEEFGGEDKKSDLGGAPRHRLQMLT